MTGSPELGRQDADSVKYPETVLHFTSEPERRVDLRIALSAADRAALSRIGSGGNFAVITAFDPLGRDLSIEENRQLAARLEVRLQELGHTFVPVDACSPDGSHREASLAVAMPKGNAVELAREFGQIAIFWYDGNRFWIVGARAATAAIALPRPQE